MKKILSLAACMSIFAATSARGAGYALIEQSASGLGNAFSGAATAAEDMSVMYFNPAGMAKLKG